MERLKTRKRVKQEVQNGGHPPSNSTSLPSLSKLERDAATSATVDIPHSGKSNVTDPVEHQASEQAKPTVEYTFSSPTAPTIDRTPEPPAHAGIDGYFPALPEGLRDRANDSLRDDRASLVEAQERVLSSKLRENGTRTSEHGNTSEYINSPAPRKLIHELVQKSLKKEEREKDTSKASSSHVLPVTDAQACPALSMLQTLWNDKSDDSSQKNITKRNTYRYCSLQGPDSIRLLGLIPHEDKHAPIQCRLFDYPLQESGEGTHLYEALSYVWGRSENPPISIGERFLHVTANLYAALLRLRHRFIERLIWVDAICIDQDNDEEKAQQIQFMAEIYSKASRVIVWLGEVAPDSDQALEAIRTAADEQSTKPSNNEMDQQAILTLLGRRWFKRIWVRAQTLNRVGKSY